jgi:hypothetical protein
VIVSHRAIKIHLSVVVFFPLHVMLSFLSSQFLLRLHHVNNPQHASFPGTFTVEHSQFRIIYAACTHSLRAALGIDGSPRTKSRDRRSYGRSPDWRHYITLAILFVPSYHPLSFQCDIFRGRYPNFALSNFRTLYLFKSSPAPEGVRFASL